MCHDLCSDALFSLCSIQGLFMQRLTFWFEYGSTYTWLSVARIDALARAYGAQIEWRPFLLSAILKQRGMVEGPFAEPVKGRYMWRDLERRAARHGIAYRKPTGSLPNTLLTARIGTLAALQGWCEAFTREVFRLHWTEDVGIGTDDNLRRALTAVGKSPEQVLQAAQSESTKQLLRAATDEAEALGVVGSPSFTVGEEVFWGDDRLEDALDFAAGRLLPAAGR
jgi:2-hydroxychromene-2-carboxylate isomerase